MINDVIDDYEDDNYLSDHSRSMRSACDYCLKIFRRFEAETNANANRIKLRSIFRKGLRDNLPRSLKDHRNRRNNAHRAFWASVKPNSSAQIETINVSTTNTFDTIHEISTDQVRYFKDRFQNLNEPCLITGLDRSPHFRYVNQHWKSNSIFAPNESSRSKRNQSKINREWFRNALGDDCLVPLRYIPLHEETGKFNSQLLLDEDGRAMECETKEVSMKAWINMLEASQQLPQTVGDDVDNSRYNDGNIHAAAKDREPNTIIYYLKDWHLQQNFPSTAKESIDDDSFVKNINAPCSLYTVPEFFGRDLLNPFLTRFTKGDYRFCYWGPSLSFTARHSDVMHSFSWSYNVVGTKKWTFYRSGPPGGNNHEEDERRHQENTCHNDCDTFTVIQETGQAIFVPATWQHKVVNLEETISINHNWITSANLDLVWDCLTVEMIAIQNELRGWACGSSDDDDENGLDQNMEACENMLRGCIGLDVTGFVLMTLVGLLEVLTDLLREHVKPLSDESVGGDVVSANKHDELVFDAIRLASVLQYLSTTEKHLLRLRSRLNAVLISHDMAQNVESMMNDLIEWIQID